MHDLSNRIILLYSPNRSSQLTYNVNLILNQVESPTFQLQNVSSPRLKMIITLIKSTFCFKYFTVFIYPHKCKYVCTTKCGFDWTVAIPCIGLVFSCVAAVCTVDMQKSCIKTREYFMSLINLYKERSCTMYMYM